MNKDCIIIGISGKATSGKDTFAERFVARHGFRRAAFADRLKDIADRILKNPDKTDPKVRRFYQELGMVVREYDLNYWIRIVEEKIERSCSCHRRWVIPDVRFHNEAQWVRDNGGILIRITRPVPALPDGLSQHASETEMDTWDDWDYKIPGTESIESMYQFVDAIVGKLMEGNVDETAKRM